MRLVVATNPALDQLELDPGIGSPVLGKALGIPDPRSWRVTGFPLLWFYFERDDHLDVVRLLGAHLGRRATSMELGERAPMWR